MTKKDGLLTEDMMVVLVLILINLNHNICYMCVVSIFRDGPLDRGYDCGSDSRQRSRQCAKAQLLVNHRNKQCQGLIIMILVICFPSQILQNMSAQNCQFSGALT